MMSKLESIKQLIHDNRIVSIQVNLLNVCTSRCVYCRKYEWPNNMLDPYVVKECLSYLIHQGLQSVVFSGGDPICYPWLKDLLAWCKKQNLQTSLITTMITERPEMLDVLGTLPTRIHCSVDSSRSDLYAKLRGVNKLPLVITNLKDVNTKRQANFLQPIRISTVLSNENYMDIANMYKLAKDTGSTLFWALVHRHDEYCMDDMQWQICREELEKIVMKDLRENITNAAQLLKHKDPRDEPKCRCTLCSIPYIHCCINADGDVYPCCVLLDDNGDFGPQQKYVYGNINTCDNDFESLFNRRFDQAYDIKDYCTRCEDRYVGLIDEVDSIMNDKRLKVRTFL